ncbi:MAG: alpha/beta fold hydrolase [Gemmatimonadaceae bacterium]|nr:alpha/beta fold hydrolase [Gemmatimonadaceae bacterium]
MTIVVDSGVQLAGTWTTPSQRGDEATRAVRDSAAKTDAANTRWPVALLLSGSGPQDRDGQRADLPGYAPLREIANALAQRGIATLRMDDRGIGQSTGSFLGATTLDFAKDAAAAVRWLRAQPEVRAERIVLVGHSEGALVSMLVAAEDSSLSGLVLLGASAQTGREIARWQRAQLVTTHPSTWPSDRAGGVLAEADSNAERTARRDPWLSVWFALAPSTIARAVRSPVLLLHGETDRQVPSRDADSLASVLRAVGTSVSVRRLPRTNHLLLPDDDGDPAQYARLGSFRLRPDVLDTIGAWILAREPRRGARL